MLFNSIEFLVFFLPITICGYYLFVRYGLGKQAKAFLLIASLIFYSWWEISYLPLMLISIIVNFGLGKRIIKSKNAKAYLYFGIVLNLSALGYYKYADFFITNFNIVFDSGLSHFKIILPLAISFFTFQQISYLVDVYRDNEIDYNFVDYGLFVSFFPQLIAGPIVHHKEVMPQLLKEDLDSIRWDRFNQGIYIFAIGLFKKVMLADTFSRWVHQGFNNIDNLTFIDSWVSTLSYTFQIYFDFSGYSDMAIGAALFFGIKLPLNFNSPYKSLNIQEFWRRWHITLGRWFRDYVYIPLGGSQASTNLLLRNLFLTAFVSGIWHGAGWTFVIWGACHGMAMVVHRLWSASGRKMNKIGAWCMTFLFVHLTFVIFRAKNLEESIAMYKKLFSPVNFGLENYGKESLLMILIGFVIVLVFKNGVEWAGFKEESPMPKLVQSRYVFVATVMIFVSILSTIAVSYTEFIYFNF